VIKSNAMNLTKLFSFSIDLGDERDHALCPVQLAHVLIAMSSKEILLPHWVPMVSFL
jgi:hypothetical protein